MKVTWKPVPGGDGYYVSDHGHVFTARSRSQVTMKAQLDKDGYEYVKLFDGKKYTKCYVHRLVAWVFVPGYSRETPYACHKNGQRRDNRATNLKWATQAENCEDKEQHGTAQRGSSHPRASINEAQAKTIKHWLERGWSARQIATYLDVSKHVVHDISCGRTWRHI